MDVSSIRRNPPGRRRLIRSGAMVLAVLSSAGSIAQVVPLGPRIEVDSIAAVPKVAVDPQGRFGLLWDKEGLKLGVLQAFDSEGHLLGPRSRLAKPDPQRAVLIGALAVDGFGGYLATWTDRDVYLERPALHARFFDFRGVPRTGVIELAGENPAGYPQLGGAARNRQGDAIVVWSTQAGGPYVIRARRFDFRGKPVGPAFNVRAAEPAGYVADPEVAVDDLGRFVVAWREFGRRGVDRFFFQRYGRDGRKRGAIRAVTGERVLQIALGKEPGGEFVAVWIFSESTSSRVLARWFDAFGRPLTDEAVVLESGDQLRDAAVTRDRFGNTIVLWWRSAGAGPLIEGRMYDRTGEPVGALFQIDRGLAPSAGIDDDGRLVVAWAVTDGIDRPRPVCRRFRLTCGPGYEQSCPD